MDTSIFPLGITFDDVLLVPQMSNILPSEVKTASKLTKNISVEIPLISAPMDTVTEAELAIALAQEGGIGIIHKNIPIDIQAREVQKVKRSENGVIVDPIVLGPSDTVSRARELMSTHHVSGFPVLEGGRSSNRLVGIVTRRDLRFANSSDMKISEIMTSKNLVTASPNIKASDAEIQLKEARVEKLLLTDTNGCLAGMITMRDLDNVRQHPLACRDSRGRLRVGAAIGVGQEDRICPLVESDVDVIVVDTAHGHSYGVLETIKMIKSRYEVDVIAGNIATADGAAALIDAGADGIKVGIGPGSICTTRVISGVGVPQLTAIIDAVSVASPAGVPVIADGGIRQSGDIAKAIGAGAHTVMLGSLFAGLDESPGELVVHGGRRYKVYRGMGSEGAMAAGSADRYGQQIESVKYVPEGVEGRVPYRGPVSDLIYQLVGGLRASMGYSGAFNIEDFREKAKFVRVTSASVIESHPHDIQIMKESSNYLVTDNKK